MKIIITKLSKASPMNFIKTCRLCAKIKNLSTCVFEEEGQNLDLLSKIHQCLQIEVCTSDVLPTIVCNDCCQKLLMNFEFFNQAKNAQVLLQSLCEVGDCSKSVQTEPSEKCAESIDGRCKKTDVHCSHNANKDPSFEAEILNVHSETSESASGMRVWLAAKYSWHCTDCSDILESPRELENHHRTVHQQPVKYLCLQCSRIYTVYKKFTRHMRLHRNEGKFRCEDCVKGFSTRQALNAHKILHSDVRPFTCRKCGHSFRQASTLYCHQRTHEPDHGTFACSHCKMMMSTQQALQHHLLSHTGGQTFTCEICGKSFTRKQTLFRHALTHTDGQSVTCQMCHKAFKTQQHLQSHLRVHSSEQAHQCDVCGRQFRLHSTLTVHSRIHTGEMPYMCEFCGQRFRFRGVYVVHRRKHTGERPYVCAVCGWAFSNYANHTKHMKRQHWCKTQEDQSQLQMDTCMTPQVSVSFCASSTTEIGVIIEKDSVPQISRPISAISTCAASHFTAMTLSPVVSHINQNNILIASCSDSSIHSTNIKNIQ